MQSVAQDDGVRRQDIDNCPLVANDYQENVDAGPIETGAVTGPDVTRPNADIFGDACDNDHDNDGRTNAEEAAGCNGSAATNPNALDTDGDGYNDGYECAAGSNPASAASTPPFPSAVDDPDLDGVPTAIELAYGSDPNSVDSDGDGLNDAIEIRHWGTAPDTADTDGDGCGDALEAASMNGDWAVNSLDLLIVAQRFGQTGSVFDANRDGAINSLDLLLLGRAFGTCVPARHIVFDE
jgi:hypothetical protein